VATQELREAMENGMPLDDIDRLCLENYISLLHLTYSEWKRQHYRPPRTNSRLSDSNRFQQRSVSPNSN